MIDLVRRKYSDPDNIRVAKRIGKHLSEFFLFLEVDDLDATNSQAERQLRPAVVTRKISCGSKTEKGAKRHSIIASVLATSKQLGHDFCAMVVEALLSFGDPVLAHEHFPADAPLPWVRAPAPAE